MTVRLRWLKLIERLVPLVLTIGVPVAGGLWAVYIFAHNQSDLAAKQAAERESQLRARFIELQKPFIQQQFDTYKAFIEAVGLVVLAIQQEKDAKEELGRYWALHWDADAFGRR